MHSSQLGALLRKLLVAGLSISSGVHCSSSISAPSGSSTDAEKNGPPADADAARDSAVGSMVTDGSLPEASSDDASTDAADAPVTPDAADASSGKCVLFGGDPDISKGSLSVRCDGPIPDPLDCDEICPRPTAQCERGAEATIVVCTYGSGGRRPAGFESSHDDALTSLGAFFSNLAELEAAAVVAFEITRAELRAHAAPDYIVKHVEAAIEDEVRHAKIMRALAERHGGRRAAARPVIHEGMRDLEAMAIENAVEGCVRETYGAIVAMHQAAHAQDPFVRRAMSKIAEDETRHAALSWELASWFESRLDAHARARVATATHDAVESLAFEAALEPSREVRELGGVPSGKEGVCLFAALRAELWDAHPTAVAAA